MFVAANEVIFYIVYVPNFEPGELFDSAYFIVCLQYYL